MKRKLLWTFGILFGLLALLVIIPLTIDWGRFKPQVLAAVESATGRKVTIAGNLSFRLLPNPRLIADHVRVAGFGSAPEPLADIDELAMGVALRPLFDSKVEAKYIRLGSPRLNLITYADDTTNWARPDAAPTKAAVALEDIRISNGHVMLKDLRDGGIQNISGITARLSLPDLNGPIAFDGNIVIDKVPLQAKGTYNEGALDIAGSMEGALAAFSFKGRVGDITAGKFTARVPNPAELAARFSDEGQKSKAPALAAPLSVSADVTKAPGGLRLENLVATLDHSIARGVLDVALSGRTKIVGAISIDQIISQRWSSGENTPTVFPYKLDLPKALDVDMRVKIGRVVLEKGMLDTIATRIVLKRAALAVDTTTLALPGNARATVSAKIRSVNGFAQVSAGIVGKIPAVHTTLAAFGLNGLPPLFDALSGSSSATLTGDELTLSGLSGRVDGSQVTGKLKAMLGKTRDYDVTLTVDQLDADRLQARLKSAPKQKPSDEPAPTARFNIVVQNLKSGGKFLGRVAGQGVYRGGDDALELARLDIANVAGYRVSGKGGFTQISKAPVTDLALSITGKNAAGTVLLSGPQSQLQTRAKINYGGAAVEATGTVNAAAMTPTFNLATSIRASELSQVLNQLAVKPDPKRLPMGALAVDLKLVGTTAAANALDITGSLGPVSLSGQASLILTGAKPDIQGNFALGDVPLRAFLGPKETGAVAARIDAADRWSQDRLDFSGFAALTGTIGLTAKRLTLDSYVFDAPRATLVFDGAGLAVQNITAQLFGGNFTGSAQLGSGTIPNLAVNFAVNGVPLQKIEEGFMASQPATGTAKIQGKISARGGSQFDMVRNLEGAGTLASEQGIIRKINLRRLNDRMKELGTVNDFIKLGVTAVQGGETAYRYFQSDWSITDGVVTIQPINSDMDGGNVSGKAAMDLPRWQVASNILIKLDDFTQAPPVGMRMSGPLTAPVTTYDFQALQKYFGVRAANAGIKAIVKGEGINPKDLLGLKKKPATPTTSEQPAATENPAPAQPQQQAAPKTPEQELKDTVLQGLGGLLKKKKPPADPQPAPPSQ